MVRTATLDLNSRGSFVDDLNSKPGIVMCRDALLHRSHEIQPAFFDSEIKRTFLFFLFSSFFFFIWKRDSAWHRRPARRKNISASRNVSKKIFSKKKNPPPPGIEPGTCRLTADRSANGALEAGCTATGLQENLKFFSQKRKKIFFFRIFFFFFE